MDKTVPKAAAVILDFIGKIEAPQGYDTIYGNNQRKLPKQITKMTLDELILAQKSWNYGSSASGRYQFMRNTLLDLKRELKLTGEEIFDANFQDRLGFHLLKRRGYEKFMQKQISTTMFGKYLAMEWASLPVLAESQGRHRGVPRGSSYYAGDRLNKALVKPEAVEAMLARALAAKGRSVGPVEVLVGGGAGGAAVAAYAGIEPWIIVALLVLVAAGAVALILRKKGKL